MSFNRYPGRQAPERQGPAVCCPACGHVLMRLEAGAFGPSAGAQPTPSAGAALLKVAEAAEQLAVSRAKLYRLISAGQVRVVRIGSSVRIPRHEIDLLAAG